MKASKTAWYDKFYKNKKILTSYPWYTGLNELLVRKNIDFTGKSVLEIGSGAGEYLNSLNGNEGTRVGLDISQTALKIANANSTGARFLCSKAEALPFPSKTFDIAICCEVIEHVDDPQKTIKEIHRILKPEGILFLSFPNYYNPIYLAVRMIATVFNKPNIISLQIVDRYLFYDSVLRKFSKFGFSLIAKKGTCYSHQKIPILRLLNRFEHIYDMLNLQFISFHPVIYLKKRTGHNDS